MSPITAISVANTTPASLNPHVSRPTDVWVDWNHPTGSFGVPSRDLATIPPTLAERDDAADASPPNPYTNRGRDRADKEAAGLLLAKQVSIYAETCADKARSVKTAITYAYHADTYEQYAEAVLAAKSMAEPDKGCPDWTAEKQTHAKGFSRGLESAWEGNKNGLNWNGVQVAIDTAAKSLGDAGASEKLDDGAETGDGSNLPDPEAPIGESRASYLAVSKLSLAGAGVFAGAMLLQ